MQNFLFDSHSLEALAEELSRQLERENLFSGALIVISHPLVKEWLQLELCKRSKNGCAVGLEFKILRPSLTRAEIAAKIWHKPCTHFPKSETQKCQFVSHMAALLAEYHEYGFPEKIPEDLLWQKDLLDLEEPFVLENRPTYLFGVDILPPRVYQQVLKHPQLRIFRFSPCAMFWEDLCSPLERKKLLKKSAGKKNVQALDAFLRDVQPLLASWGALGRRMLAPEVTAENYEIEEQNTALHRLKLNLLLSENEGLTWDDSIRSLKTGASRIDEVKILREEILRLGIPFSEIRVYAPDMAIYAPLVQFCFTDIPFRIAGVDLARQSPFYQALLRAFGLVHGRWEAGDLLALFEMPPFYRKMGWKPEQVQRIREWVEEAAIRWGIDAEHRGIKQGTWEAGIETLLDSWIYLQPEKEFTMGWSESELFESFYEVFEGLKNTLLSWRTERTLQEWSVEIEHFIDTYLIREDEIFTLPLSTEKYPFTFVETFFFSTQRTEINGSLLHAVRFASLETGAILPARAVFVLGMDEESFPRPVEHSSLRIPNGAPQKPELDRYLFLQLLFAAKERLTFSYSHLEEGKEVNPSLLLQELGVVPSKAPRPFYTTAKKPSLLTNTTQIPSPAAAKTIQVQDLTRFIKNPFQHYFKSLGIELPEEPESAWAEFEYSGLSRYLALRGQNVIMPLGLFAEAAQIKLDAELAKLKDSYTINYKSDLLVGELPFATSQGALHLGSDTIGSMMRRWPEMLCILVAQGVNQIQSVKTGRIFNVSDPKQALESLMELYLRCQHTPLFMHPDWADALLRKNSVPEESEDRILRWALARSPDYDLSAEKKIWEETLRQSFSALVALFPTRGSHAEV